MSGRTLSRTGTFEVRSWVERETWGCKAGLDLGSGLGAYTRKMLCPVKVGIEAFEPYVVAARADPENEDCQFILGDMRQWESLVDRDYDLAMFIDTLEHLPKPDAFDLIARCQERFSKILLFLPLGPHIQGPCDNNELQCHLSHWNELDVESMDFSGTVCPIDPEDGFSSDSDVRLKMSFLTWVKP